MILVVICLYSFLGNSALTGIAPYVVVYSMTFGISPTEASNLLTYPSLAYGFSTDSPAEHRDMTVFANCGIARLAYSRAIVPQDRKETRHVEHDRRRGFFDMNSKNHC